MRQMVAEKGRLLLGRLTRLRPVDGIDGDDSFRTAYVLPELLTTTAWLIITTRFWRWPLVNTVCSWTWSVSAFTESVWRSPPISLQSLWTKCINQLCCQKRLSASALWLAAGNVQIANHRMHIGEPVWFLNITGNQPLLSAFIRVGPIIYRV